METHGKKKRLRESWEVVLVSFIFTFLFYFDGIKLMIFELRVEYMIFGDLGFIDCDYRNDLIMGFDVGMFVE